MYVLMALLGLILLTLPILLALKLSMLSQVVQ